MVRKNEGKPVPELTIPHDRSSRRLSQASARSAGTHHSARSGGDRSRGGRSQGGSSRGGRGRINTDTSSRTLDTHVSIPRRPSVETYGTSMSMGGQTSDNRSGVYTVDMLNQSGASLDRRIEDEDEDEGVMLVSTVSFNAPPSGDEEDNEDVEGGGDDRRGGQQLHHPNRSSSMHAEQDAEETGGFNRREASQKRQRSQRRLRDQSDFRTSITKIPVDLVQNNDEHPDFWNVSQRWFSDANEFAGELTGMATRRASAAAAGMPRTQGVQIVSAVDGDDSDSEKGDGEGHVELKDSPKGIVSHHVNAILGSHDDDDDDDDDYDSEEDEDDEHEALQQFDELSSIGDTPTYIFSVQTNTKAIRGGICMAVAFMLIWMCTQIALQSSSWFHDWQHVRSSGINPIWKPRRSHRYGKMKSKLVTLYGDTSHIKEMLENEESPQHKALVYLADGDSLELVSTHMHHS